MIPRPARLTRSAGFTAAVRGGERAGSRLVVLHLHHGAADGAGPRIGFVVARSVGVAVVRNRVKRRLKHLLRPRVATLPPGSVLVVRALPASAGASYADLERAVERGLARLGVEDGVQPDPDPRPVGSPVKYPLIWLLRGYRLVISPLYGQVCRYHPSCSAYALESVSVHGSLRGSWLAARRVLRCHPWAKGRVRPRSGPNHPRSLSCSAFSATSARSSSRRCTGSSRSSSWASTTCSGRCSATRAGRRGRCPSSV